MVILFQNISDFLYEFKNHEIKLLNHLSDVSNNKLSEVRRETKVKMEKY